MNPVPKFRGKVENGKIKLENQKRFTEYVPTLEGKEVSVTVSPYVKIRSDAENKYYHGVLVDMLADELGYSHDEMHEVLKYELLKTTICGMGKDGKVTERDIVRSTASLSTAGFEKYCEDIRRWAAVELSIYLPLPNEVMIEEN